MTIHSGDILAFRGTGLVSELIQHVEGGAYSHVAVAFVEPDGALAVLEAREGAGVRKVAAKGYIDSYKVDRVECAVNWTCELETFALSKLGQPYSYLAALDVGLGLTPPDGAQICSLYARDVLTQAGFSFPRRGMTPQALVDDLLDAGKSLSHFV